MKARVTGDTENNKKEQFKVTPEMLKDGTVLCGLVIRFLNNKNQENMFSLLSCLRDSNVFVPCEVSVNGGEPVVGGNDPVIFPSKQQLQFKPQLYKATDGNIYMPFYTRQENVKMSELKGASLVNLPYEKLVEMLKDSDECGRFVIDPKLYNVVLDEELVRISMELPSRLGKR